jgi:hypothetical protein
VGDALVGLARCDQPQHLQLTAGQRLRPGTPLRALAEREELADATKTTSVAT